MNVLNRILIILLDLVMIVVTAAIDAVALGWLPLHEFSQTHWFYNRLAPFTGVRGWDYNETLIICSGLLFLGLVLLGFEFATLFHRRDALMLQRDGLGRVTVDRAVVRAMASHEAGQVAGVMSFDPHVAQDRSGLQIQGRLAVEPQANLSQVTQEVQSRVKEGLERSTGWPVEDVRVEAGLPARNGGRHLR